MEGGVDREGGGREVGRCRVLPMRWWSWGRRGEGWRKKLVRRGGEGRPRMNMASSW